MSIRNTVHSYSCRKGFTVLEAMITLAILGLMAGMASTSFVNLSAKYRLKKAVWEVNTHMNYARYKAILDGLKVRIVFDSTSYSIEEYDESQKKWKRERVCFLEGVILRANNGPIFHPGGDVSNLVSIYISNSMGKYKITLAISGRIKTTKL